MPTKLGACAPAKLRVKLVALITTSWRTEDLLPHIVSLFLSFSNLCNLCNLWIALRRSERGGPPRKKHGEILTRGFSIPTQDDNL